MMSVLKDMANVTKKPSKMRGTLQSHCIRSSPNRLMMRPDGVESKKVMGHPRMRFNSTVCIFLATCKPMIVHTCRPQKQHNKPTKLTPHHPMMHIATDSS